jgi:hypothetical protein
MTIRFGRVSPPTVAESKAEGMVISWVACVGTDSAGSPLPEYQAALASRVSKITDDG